MIKKALGILLLYPAILAFFLFNVISYFLWFITALLLLLPVLIISRGKRGHPIDKKVANFLDRWASTFSKSFGKTMEFKDFPINTYYKYWFEKD